MAGKKGREIGEVQPRGGLLADEMGLGSKSIYSSELHKSDKSNRNGYGYW